MYGALHLGQLQVAGQAGGWLGGCGQVGGWLGRCVPQGCLSYASEPQVPCLSCPCPPPFTAGLGMMCIFSCPGGLNSRMHLQVGLNSSMHLRQARHVRIQTDRTYPVQATHTLHIVCRRHTYYISCAGDTHTTYRVQASATHLTPLCTAPAELECEMAPVAPTNGTCGTHQWHLWHPPGGARHGPAAGWGQMAAPPTCDGRWTGSRGCSPLAPL